MHMADALISTVVGGTMYAATASTTTYSIKKIKKDLDDKKVPLMGIMGAFVFAAQMINFTIPGTGSSGHLGGGLLLAIILGPYAGFITMASVLLIQALFFADGGLLALGCNIFNLGFYTCFIAYPFIYKRLIRKGYTTKKIFIASIFSSVVALQMGAFSVVLQTVFSGKTELPFGTFAMLMQPIHLAIGVIEGMVTAAVVSYVWKARPEIIDNTIVTGKTISFKKVLITLILSTFLIGGVFSWFASSNPDGLEWSISKIIGTTEIENNNDFHEKVSTIQNKTAILPDYNFKESNTEEKSSYVDIGTSVSGITGGVIVMSLSVLVGYTLNKIKIRNKSVQNI